MLENQKTKDLFGYYCSELRKGSQKKIIALCDFCNKEQIVIYKGYLKSYNQAGLNKYSCKQCRRNKEQEIDLILGRDKDFKNRQMILKYKQTCIEKYNVDNPSKRDENKQKIKKTWTLKSKEEIAEIKRKREETFNKNPEAKEKKLQKFKQTNLYRYGVNNPSQFSDFKIKREETMLKKFGVNNFSLHSDFKKRLIETSRKKYGIDFPTQVREFKIKGINTKIEKYGSSHSNNHFGKTQKEIQEWLNSFNFKFKSSCWHILGDKEIDLYDDNIKVAIEYCGLYWHNEQSLDPKLKDYHYNKYKKCNEKDIRLITIFEDEWLTRNFQVKSFLRAALKKNEISIGGRQCKIDIIDKSTASKFFDLYHIQGANLLAYLCCGLYYNDELVAAMSFGRHHRQQDVVVLDRLCFKENITIMGGVSKMFKFLIEKSDANKIISWSDNRWSIGNVYKKLGFTLEEELTPDYSYFNSYSRIPTRLSKQSQRKSITRCPKNLTEKEYCLSRGLYRIWDCGKKRWSYTI